MAISAANFTAFLKENYTYDTFADVSLGMKSAKLYHMLKKNEKIGGDSYKVPLIYGSNTRRSATFATAQAAADSTSYAAFKMTLAQDYCLSTWSGKAMKSSEGDANAFAALVKVEMDRSIRALTHSMATKLFRSGHGSICTISSTATVASAALILNNASDAANWEVGDVVVASATDGSALRTGSATISAINRSTGTLTTAGGNWSTQITSLATGDMLYKSGDASNTGATICVEGLRSFGPAATTALTAAYYNVTRSTDQSRLAFWFHDNTAAGNGDPIDECLVKAVSAVKANGGDPDAIFLNPVKYRSLLNRMSTKITRVDQKKGEISFGKIVLLTDDGEIAVYSDVHQDERYADILQLDTLELVSPGPAIGFLDFDGAGDFLRVYNGDSYEARLGGYPQLACNAPGFNGVVTL